MLISDQALKNSVPLTETWTPETMTSAVKDQGSPSIGSGLLYGVLYESVFPKDFSSEVLLALLDPPPHLMVTLPVTEILTVHPHQEDDPPIPAVT